MAMVKEAVRLGILLPKNATRDELRAYTKLAGEQTQRWRQAMEEQEREERERRSSHRQFTKNSRDSPTHDRSKINNLRKTERERVIRKLDDDFKLEEDDDDEEPLTPAEALISAREYLSRAQKSKKDGPDCNITMALKIMKDAITASAPKKSGARRLTHEHT